jgi:hypothetical protein
MRVLKMRRKRVTARRKAKYVFKMRRKRVTASRKTKCVLKMRIKRVIASKKANWRKKIIAVMKYYELKYNKVAGYVSYKNLNKQLGHNESEYQVPTTKKLKESISWKQNYGCYSSLEKHGFCIIDIRDQTIRDKIDKLHKIISAKKFNNRPATKIFNTIKFDQSQKILKLRKAKDQYKLDGGRNQYRVHKMPEGYAGKALSIEIGEYIRGEFLKKTNQNTEETSTKTCAATKESGMVLTWLETQGPVQGHRVSIIPWFLFQYPF